MATNARLAFALFQAGALCVAAILLWGTESSLLPESSLDLDFLVWPVVIAAVLSFSVDLVFWVQGIARLRSALRLPERFVPGWGLVLRMAQRLLGDAS